MDKPKPRPRKKPYNQAPHKDPGSHGTGTVKRGGGGGRSVGYLNNPVNGNTLSHGNSVFNTVFGAPRPNQGAFVKRVKEKTKAQNKMK